MEQIPPYQANIKVVCKRRYVYRPLDSAGVTSEDATVYGVCAQDLCRSVAMMQDDTAVNPVVWGLFSAVKVLGVRMYFAPPSFPAGEATSKLPLSGGWTISIQPNLTSLGSQFQLGEISDTSVSPMDIAHVSWYPKEQDFPAVATYQSSSSTAPMFYIKAYLGCVVDIEMCLILADGGYTSTFTTTSGAVNGTMGYGYLDSSVASSARSWQPVSATVAWA